jgi:hypothetical protein
LRGVGKSVGKQTRVGKLASVLSDRFSLLFGLV